jgi:hypothetical protein
MKESYRKGVASRSGPESCVAGRMGVVEALTGEGAGQVMVPSRIDSGRVCARSPTNRRFGQIRSTKLSLKMLVGEEQEPSPSIFFSSPRRVPARSPCFSMAKLS